MLNFKNFDDYFEELIFGAQGNYCKNIIDFANHLQIKPSLLINYTLNLIINKDISSDWGNLGSFSDKLGITEEDKNRIIKEIKFSLYYSN